MRFEIYELPANRLIVDPVVQRKISQAQVDRIAAEYRDENVGVLIVSKRKGGTFHIIDGGHRHAAQQMVYGEDNDKPLQCQVYTGLSRQQEAEMFLRHNDRRSLTGIDLFRIAVEADELWAVMVNQILLRYGWKDAKTGHMRFKAITTIRQVWDSVDDWEEAKTAIERAFCTVTDAWGTNMRAGATVAVGGIGMFYVLHPKAEPKRFVTKLLKVSLQEWYTRVELERDFHGGTNLAAGYRTALYFYNKGRKSGLLVDKW